jgi:replicative superfamily II helicase
MLAAWLDNAKFYISRYRPVPVEEHLVFDNAVYDASTSSRFYKTATQLNAQTQRASQIKPQPCRLIQESQSIELSNPLVNAVVSLANETARAGYGALVFCSSRMGCERDAVLISQVLPRPEEVDSETRDKRRDLLNDLRSSSTGLDRVLEKTVLTGVAFHRKFLRVYR